MLRCRRPWDTASRLGRLANRLGVFIRAHARDLDPDPDLDPDLDPDPNLPAHKLLNPPHHAPRGPHNPRIPQGGTPQPSTTGRAWDSH